MSKLFQTIKIIKYLSFEQIDWKQELKLCKGKYDMFPITIVFMFLNYYENFLFCQLTLKA